MKISLRDGAPKYKGSEVEVTVLKNGNTVEISVDGFGSKDAPPGEGSIIVLEHYMGRLVCHVYGNVNAKAATHTVDLDGARETKRKADGFGAPITVNSNANAEHETETADVSE